MDLFKKRENAEYRDFQDVSHRSVLLKEFNKAILDMRYRMDSPLGGRVFHEAMKHIVDDQKAYAENESTVKALEAVMAALDENMKTMFNKQGAYVESKARM